jgi:hypothetical protein
MYLIREYRLISTVVTDRLAALWYVLPYPQESEEFLLNQIIFITFSVNHQIKSLLHDINNKNGDFWGIVENGKAQYILLRQQ